MAGPATPLIDTYTRANEDPMVNASNGTDVWSAIPGMGGIGGTNLKVDTNRCAGDGGTIGGMLLSPTYNANCEIYVAVATLGNDGELVDLIFRGKDTGAITTIDGYSVRWTKAAGTDTIVLYRIDNLGTTVLATFNQEVAAADAFGAVMVSSNIEAFYKASAGSWTSLGTASDSTYVAGGRHMMSITGTTIRVDDFGGGNYVAPSGLPFFMQSELLAANMQSLSGGFQ